MFLLQVFKSIWSYTRCLKLFFFLIMLINIGKVPSYDRLYIALRNRERELKQIKLENGASLTATEKSGNKNSGHKNVNSDKAYQDKK